MKTVLITAGTKNTGFVMAKLFAQKGWEVHLTSRDEKAAFDAAEKLKTEVPGTRAFGYGMDQGNSESLKSAFLAIRQNTEKLDALVCNAANLGLGLDVFNLTEEDFDTVMDCNLKGTLFVAREAAKLMLGGGSMVLMGSVQGKGAIEGRLLYGVSKAGIAAMSQYLAFDLAPYGIRVNTLVAGAIRTNRWDGITPEEEARRRAPYPVGRESSMEEIAKGVYYLASEDSATVTGTELVIDSGVLLPILPYANRKKLRHEEFETEAASDQKTAEKAAR